MKQPTRNGKIPFPKGKPKARTGVKRAKEYGTSKLERDFAHDFLDRNGIKYIYQYKAEDIGRYYDFAVTAEKDYPYDTVEINGITSIKQGKQPFKIDLIIEVDGDYHHANPALISESELTPMHKHNRMVDKIKDRWCAMNCIPMVRIWESDIRKNPEKVMERLSKYIAIAEKRVKRRKVRRHR